MDRATLEEQIAEVEALVEQHQDSPTWSRVTLIVQQHVSRGELKCAMLHVSDPQILRSTLQVRGSGGMGPGDGRGAP